MMSLSELPLCAFVCVLSHMFLSFRLAYILPFCFYVILGKIGAGKNLRTHIKSWSLQMVISAGMGPIEV